MIEVATAYRSGSLAASIGKDGIAVVRFSGLVTASTLHELKLKSAGLVANASARAIVADYSSAVLAISHEEAHRMMYGGGPENLLELPAAVVVINDENGHLRAAAIHAAAAGRLRVVVSHQQDALGWAQAMRHALPLQIRR